MSEKTGTLASETEAREVAEAARETEWEHQSFASGLFNGRPDFGLLDRLPTLDPDEQERAEDFLRRLKSFVESNIDGDRIDREEWVPEEVLDGLRKLGCFGIKIPREYGGLGFSQTTYNEALALVASRCGSTGAFLSAHQSIGVPQPLMLFGTDEQKEHYLPRLAGGALSAFALTEPDVGSDPANLSTFAEPSDDGEAFILNGEKLWTTNGPRAELMVVMARTPAREGVKGKKPITAFIVESDWPGVEVLHECHFMGLRGISNGVLKFTNVRVPKTNVLWGEGLGLKLALITLNTGRLSLPSFCAVAGKGCLQTSRLWAKERVQWGQPIGKHDAIAQKLASMAADSFAMDSVVHLTSVMADSHRLDIRLEAAIAKMWNSERAWLQVNEALQIRGGRGYETAASLAARGEAPIPVERWLRDLRINMIFEGSSEIMRLFIAREAVDTHLAVAGDLVNPRASMGKRLASLAKAAVFYAWWYPSRWIGWAAWPSHSDYGKLAQHVRYVDGTSRRLARCLFYAMVRFGPKLEKRQAVLGRMVDIGAELFAMSATCHRARDLVRENRSDQSPLDLADAFCWQSRYRISERFATLFYNADTRNYGIARRAMDGEFAWVEEGMARLDLEGLPAEAAAPSEAERLTAVG